VSTTRVLLAIKSARGNKNLGKEKKQLSAKKIEGEGTDCEEVIQGVNQLGSRKQEQTVGAMETNREGSRRTSG